MVACLAREKKSAGRQEAGNPQQTGEIAAPYACLAKAVSYEVASFPLNSSSSSDPRATTPAAAAAARQPLACT
ncbi:hypothetical protein P8C59_001522 [Phyllachora maydis]|uniref:Uncharacterized protein n=1 Tax=Phyllachora maydis TaxID=1825666 RepID=A0AAD9MCD3_9PEZI|nr:hypothetical protein P8C59_001522 [Phyllachora maydis]